MGWFSSNKNPETDYDSIITTTGDLKQVLSIVLRKFLQTS